MPGLEPISPELALVSPELAAEARRALSDRPWEAFAPPRPAPPARVEPPALRLAAPPLATAEPPPAERPRRRVVTPSRVMTAAVVGLLIVTGLLPPRNAPRLVAEPLPAAAVAATPPTFSIVPPNEVKCATGRGGQRDPFRPVCPPGRAR